MKKWISITHKPLKMKAFQLSESMMTSGELDEEKRIEGRLIGNSPMFFINTLYGKVRATPSDWIIESPQGDIYPMNEDEFNKMFDYQRRYL